MKIIVRLLPLILFIALSISTADPSYAQQYVSQGAWAVGIVKGLGWESKGIPQQPSLMDYMDLLSGRNFINVNLKNYATRLGTFPDTLTYNVNVEHCGRYRLIVYVYGNPVLFTMDNEPTVSSHFSNGWNYEEPATFILKRGVHRLSITIPKGSSIFALYLSSMAENAIQPKGGWVAAKPLDYGAEASTLTMAMDVAGKLPVQSEIPPAVRAGANARQFTFQIPSDPVLNFNTTFQGPSRGYVMVDNSIVIPYEVRGTDAPPLNMKAINLGQGTHTAYLKILSGQAPSSFVIYQHNDSPEACSALMRSMGFNMGLAYLPVPYDIARASLGAFIVIVAKTVPYNIARVSLEELIARMAKNKMPNELDLSGLPVKQTELPSQRVIRTYKEPISPMVPFED